MPGTPSSLRLSAAVACIAALGLIWGCGGGGSKGPGRSAASAPAAAVPATIALTSPAFGEGAKIPSVFTCQGFDDSPPLRWSKVPRGTAELALIMEDQDAHAFAHWTVYGIPPRASGLPRGSVPAGAKEGATDFHQSHYGGPCPPPGDPPHHYVFTLYALRAPSSLPAGAAASEVRAAARRLSIAIGLLSATFSRG